MNTDITSKPVAVSGFFSIDGSDVVFPGFTFGDTWNGFACPYFTKNIGDSVITALTDIGVETPLSFDAAADAFVELIPISTTETERGEYKGEDIETAEGIIHVYGIGNSGWTWSQVNEQGEWVRS